MILWPSGKLLSICGSCQIFSLTKQRMVNAGPQRERPWTRMFCTSEEKTTTFGFRQCLHSVSAGFG